MENLTLQDCFKYPNAGIKKIANDYYVNCRINKIDFISETIVVDGFSQEIDRPVVTRFDISDCKLILRPLSSLTDQEKEKLSEIFHLPSKNNVGWFYEMGGMGIYRREIVCVDYLRSISVDIDGFIESGKAVLQS